MLTIIDQGLIDSQLELVLGLVDRGNLIPIVAIGGGLTIGLIAVVFGAVREMVVSSQREQTRREIAAYVAEGSIDPDRAIAMLEAGRSPKSDEGGRCC